MHKFDLDEPTKKAVYKYLRMINSFCLIEIKHLSKYKHLWKQERVWMPISFFFNKKISTYNKIIYCLSQFSFYPLKSNRVKD